jgi:hypothetical protein
MADTPPSDPASMIASAVPPRSPNMPDTPVEPEPTADQDKDEGTYIEFPVPEGFQPPADAKPGKTFQALATLKLDEDGKSLCLVAVDGAAVKPEDEEPETPDGEEQPPATPGPAPTTAQEALKQGLPSTGIPA